MVLGSPTLSIPVAAAYAMLRELCYPERAMSMSERPSDYGTKSLTPRKERWGCDNESNSYDYQTDTLNSNLIKKTEALYR